MQYIYDASMTHNIPAALGMLMWNFVAVYGGGNKAELGLGESTQVLTLHFAAAANAPTGLQNFAVTFNAYDA